MKQHSLADIAVIAWRIRTAVFAFVYFVLGFLFATVLFLKFAHGQEYHKWFEAQHDCAGNRCCGVADGSLFDGDYKMNSDGSVTVNKKEKVDSCQVLKGPNPTGSAVIWRGGAGTGKILCFALGSGS